MEDTFVYTLDKNVKRGKKKVVHFVTFELTTLYATTHSPSSLGEI